jgi:DNA-binding NarL/FixJ family response regulator
MTEAVTRGNDRLGDGQPIRVVVLDDTAYWRGVGETFGKTSGNRVEIVTRAATASEALTLARHGEPDVMLLDDYVPWETGGQSRQNAVRLVLKIVAELGASRPRLVLWSNRIDPRDAYAFCFYGGDLVCDRDTDHPEQAAIDAALRAARGEREIFPEPDTGMHGNYDLIERNLIVLAGLEEHMQNAEIAEHMVRMGPAAPSAEVHAAEVAKLQTRIEKQLSRMRIKLGVERGGREALVARAQDAGFRWVRISDARRAYSMAAAHPEAGIPVFYRYPGADADPDDDA